MNQGKIKDFTDLDTWKIAHDLVLSIYKTSKKFPDAEKFGRQSYREKVQFYYLAHGSLIEVKNQLILAKDLEYINNDYFIKILEKITLSQKLLQGLIKTSKSFIMNKS